MKQEKYYRLFVFSEICSMAALVIFLIVSAINTGQAILDLISYLLVAVILIFSILTYISFILLKKSQRR